MTKSAILAILLSSINFFNLNNFQSEPLKTGWYYVLDKPNQFKRQLEKTKDVYFLDPTPIITVKQFAQIAVEKDNSMRAEAIIKFNDVATTTWSQATQKALNKKLALIIDDRLIIAPIVHDQITSGISAINRSDYTKEELDGLVKIIKAEMKN